MKERYVHVTSIQHANKHSPPPPPLWW